MPRGARQRQRRSRGAGSEPRFVAPKYPAVHFHHGKAGVNGYHPRFASSPAPYRMQTEGQKQAVRAVVAAPEPRAEAKRLRCSHALIDGDAVPL